MEVAPHLKESLNANFFDLLATFRQISGDSVQRQLHVQRVEVPVYLTLYSPAINWILQCIAYRAPEVRHLLDSDKGAAEKNQSVSNMMTNSFSLIFVPTSATSHRDDGEM